MTNRDIPVTDAMKPGQHFAGCDDHWCSGGPDCTAQASPPVGGDLVERATELVREWQSANSEWFKRDITEIVEGFAIWHLSALSTPKVKEASVGDAIEPLSQDAKETDDVRDSCPTHASARGLQGDASGARSGTVERRGTGERRDDQSALPASGTARASNADAEPELQHPDAQLAALSPQPATRGVDAEALERRVADAIYASVDNLTQFQANHAAHKAMQVVQSAIATIAPQLDVREALLRIEHEGQLSADTYGCANCAGFADLARSTLSNVQGSPE